MSFPYWPNMNGAYQQLNYISSSQALSIVPGGNTVFLNVGGGSGSAASFGTVNVSSFLNIGPPGQIAVFADADTKLKTFVDAGTSTIREAMTNGFGTVITPALVFQPETDSLLIQGTNGSTILTATTGQSLTIPFLNVSTLNGVAFPNTSTIGFNGTNFPGGAGTVPISNVPFAMTQSFAVDPTHRYRVSFEAAYNNADATGPNYTTAYISGTSPTMYITTIDNRNAIPANNDLRASVGSVFVPNSSPCQIITANSSGLAATGMTVNAVAGVVLEDLGPV
jgi:hypothetical protein